MIKGHVVRVACFIFSLFAAFRFLTSRSDGTLMDLVVPVPIGSGGSGPRWTWWFRSQMDRASAAVFPVLNLLIVRDAAKALR